MTKHKKSSKQYLNVICPACGAFKNKECKHTSKAKKGKTRKEPHDDRVSLARVKLAPRKEVEVKSAKKNPHDKLTPEQKEVVKTIVDKIEVLGKHVEFVGPVSQGPIIDTYRFLPVRRTKVAHIEALHKDFAVALGAESVLVKRMPGESAIGVFVPRKEALRKKVIFSDTMSNVTAFMKEPSDDGHLKIPLNFGIDSNGEPFVDDLTQQPHLMIAGSTGSGKSTVEHAIALSMLWELSPDQLNIIISDTKGVEFRKFTNIPHLKCSNNGPQKICTDVYATMSAFEWCITETQKRLNLFKEIDVRNIHEYNERTVSDGKLPYIVVFIDELADVIAEGPGIDRQEAKINASKLSTIVARSRASGVHVIAATQRPSVNIVKGSIKSNFSSRLSFRLPSSTDSRTVLNTKGAEALMRKGDGLYMSSTSSDLKRIHGPYAKLDEVQSTVDSIVQRYSPTTTIEHVLGKQSSTYAN